MTPKQLGEALTIGIFSDRGTNIREAFDYAYTVADASDNPIAVRTAIHVVVNTIANKLIEMGAQDETTTPA